MYSTKILVPDFGRLEKKKNTTYLDVQCAGDIFYQIYRLYIPYTGTILQTALFQNEKPFQ